MSETVDIVMYFVWAVIMVIAIIIEVETTIFIGWAAFFAGGFALLTHAIVKKPLIEVIVFITTWLFLWSIMFMLGKYVFKKRLHQKEDGYMSFIGKTYIVKKANKIVFGYLAINDKYFRFISDDKLNVGDQAIIKEIKGVTFKVNKVVTKTEEVK